MKVGIISIGLIGGSLLKRLAKSGKNEIYAVTGNEDTKNSIKTITRNVANNPDILSDCEIIFIASPISKTSEILDKLETIVKKDTIVLDCASVKEEIMKKERPYKFIGSHPMAGTENSGYKNSFEELFEGAKWVLTPSKNIEKKDILKAEKIITETGAEVVIADEKEHDRAVAQISHMPLLLAQALFMSVKDNKLALKLASSGFRDMTRLALSNLEMAEDMRKFNKTNIDNAIKELENCIEILKNAKDKEIFADIKNMRKSMYSQEGKNIT